MSAARASLFDRALLGVVGAVFLAAGISKAIEGREAVGALVGSVDSAEAARAIVAAAAGVETALGAFLLLRPGRTAAYLAAALLALLTGWLLHLDAAFGMETPCGCGLSFLGEKGWAPLLRNGLLLALCFAATVRSTPPQDGGGAYSTTPSRRSGQ